MECGDFQAVLVIKKLPVNAGDIRDMASIPGSRRSPGGGHGNPLQYSCLENPMGGGAWWATVRGTAEADMTEATYRKAALVECEPQENRSLFCQGIDLQARISSIRDQETGCKVTSALTVPTLISDLHLCSLSLLSATLRQWLKVKR